MKTLELNDGNRIPCIGFGTWRIENGAATVDAVRTAIECGYRSVDSAYSYGNDFSIGKALRQCGVPRDELYITNKVWNDFRKYDDVIQVCKRTLKLMKLDYLDLYLIHWPATAAECENWKEINAESWRAMERLKEIGLVRSIGVSNFEREHLDALLETSAVVPAVDQIEFHPGKCRTRFLDWLNGNGIICEAWSPLGSGRILKNEVLTGIAKTHGVTPAQVCIRWCVQHGAIPLPRSSNAERIRENISVFDFSCTEKEMAAIDELVLVGDKG